MYRESVLEEAAEVVERLHERDEGGTNPGIVISSDRLPEELYWRAVKDVVDTDEIRNHLRHLGGARWAEFGNGRGGIIGASASIAWPGERHTFEALVYREPRAPETPKGGVMWRIGGEMAEGTRGGTFNNIDRRNGHVALFPAPITPPVVLGVRGGRTRNPLPRWPAGHPGCWMRTAT
ncbi:DUF1743 domain-containing protein [Thermogymnomonas acidicola]|uniref:TiaS agmantine-binding domain-containing protein n=1 Tax=Thermogymnomonas acidicola TaxID=399579 RepID=UPI00094666FC|nr:DUF1743 domain-containing protein [Thermogymnomonas acidicola]